MKILGMGIPELIIILVLVGVPVLIAVLVSRSSKKKAQRLFEQSGQQFDSAPPPPVGVQRQEDVSAQNLEVAPQQPSMQTEGYPEPPLAAQKITNAQSQPAVPPQVPMRAAKQEALSDAYLYQAFAGGAKGGKPEERLVLGIASEDFMFSGFALLTGPFYFAYRKCLTESLVILLVLGFTIAIDIPVTGTGTGLLCGFIFYPLYRRRAKKAVEQAKIEGCDQAALEKLRAQGGTNGWLVLLVLAIYILEVLLIIFVETALF